MIKKFLSGFTQQSLLSRAQSFIPRFESSLLYRSFASKSKEKKSKSKEKKSSKQSSSSSSKSKSKSKSEDKKSKSDKKKAPAAKKQKKKEEPMIPTQDYIKKQLKFSTHNYHPLGVVIKSARGLYMKDVQNKRYMDFLAAYSAVNQGHAHPKILSAFKNQMSKVTLTSRAFHSDQLGQTCQFLSKHFKYDKVLMMNSGVQAVESSIKIARKWAYQVKGVAKDEARVIFATGNFMGRTIALIGPSDQHQRNHNFGPFGQMNFDMVEYNNFQALQKMIEKNAKNAKNTAAVFLQPIQGQAGIIIPDKGYIKKVSQLCKKHNILFIADQIQSGLGRTGKWLAIEWDKVKPDIITLGKALGGGVYPVSAVLGSEQVMSVLTPGTHGSTFGGNPLACAVARSSIQVLKDEQLVKNSAKLGKVMTKLLNELESPLISKVRNRGLMGALQIKKGIKGASAWDLCLAMKDQGVLAKPTHENIIRLTPPLIIKQQQLEKAFDKIQKSLKKLQKIAKFEDTELQSEAQQDSNSSSGEEQDEEQSGSQQSSEQENKDEEQSEDKSQSEESQSEDYTSSESQ